MIVFLTGETGSGKTDTGWVLIAALKAVFLECDWFASRTPFSWESAADVASVYRALLSQMRFHIAEGRKNFVITLTHEMALIFKEHAPQFEKFGLPIHAFRLAARPHIVQGRIGSRDRDQKGVEVIYAPRQRQALDRAFGDDSVFVVVDNTAFDADMTANIIIRQAGLTK